MTNLPNKQVPIAITAVVANSSATQADLDVGAWIFSGAWCLEFGALPFPHPCCFSGFVEEIFLRKRLK